MSTTPQVTQKVQIALLEREVSDLKNEVAELNTSVKELVDAWKAATGFLKFVRVLGWTAAAVTSIYALFNAKVFH
jgi:hypothetical protein